MACLGSARAGKLDRRRPFGKPASEIQTSVSLKCGPALLFSLLDRPGGTRKGTPKPRAQRGGSRRIWIAAHLRAVTPQRLEWESLSRSGAGTHEASRGGDMFPPPAGEHLGRRARTTSGGWEGGRTGSVVARGDGRGPDPIEPRPPPSPQVREKPQHTGDPQNAV